MQVDYIIVGFGLAGLAFAEILESNQKSFIVFNDASQQSSKVAAGVYNPVILKRFTPVWDAENQLKIALPFYKHLEKKLNKKYDYQFDIYRILTSVAEQNNWFAASDKPLLSSFMHPTIVQNSNSAVKAPYGLGKLTGTGKIAIEKLITDFTDYLQHQERIVNETFLYDAISFVNEGVRYKDIFAKKIIFCEGFGLKKNPFFNNLPMNEAKGELITIHAPDLQLDFMLKAAVFIMPLGNDLYKVGATFNWKDKTTIPSKEGKKELLEKLDTIINVPYRVVDHVAGIRPTVKDRRPLLGTHKKYKQLAVLNGLGTRGVMLAPAMAQLLYAYIEKETILPKEIAIERFQ